MKKVTGTIFTIFTIFILSGCGSSIHEDLQANNWNVVSTNGEAYTADFSESTVTFDLQVFNLGFQYDVDEEANTITLKEDTESDDLMFDVEKADDEYTFTAQDEEVYEQYGNLSLSPIQTE